MNSTLCRTLRKMLSDGFEQYNGEIDPTVYIKLNCTKPKEAYWVCRWPLLHCLGCNKRCTPKSPEGFQVVLPIAKGVPKYDITPWEMINSKPLLLAAEAAYCLSVKPRTIYKMAEEGILNRHVSKPMRVTSESVLEEMGRVEMK